MCSLFLGESTIPIKKRYHNASNSSDMAPPFTHTSSSGSSETNEAQTPSAPSVNLTDWLKRRVLALYRRGHEDEKGNGGQLSQSYPGYNTNNNNNRLDACYLFKEPEIDMCSCLLLRRRAYPFVLLKKEKLKYTTGGLK